MKTLIGLWLICLPLAKLRISSGYGLRMHPMTGKHERHTGVDLKARRDTVFAVLDGWVKSTGYSEGLGINVRLQHQGHVQSIYGHLSRILVGPKEFITSGEPIGITGATGRVTGEHLHFSIYYKDKYINPIQFLYELLIKKENEQKFQSAADSACRQVDRRNQRR